MVINYLTFIYTYITSITWKLRSSSINIFLQLHWTQEISAEFCTEIPYFSVDNVHPMYNAHPKLFPLHFYLSFVITFDLPLIPF